MPANSRRNALRLVETVGWRARNESVHAVCLADSISAAFPFPSRELKIRADDVTTAVKVKLTPMALCAAFRASDASARTPTLTEASRQSMLCNAHSHQATG